MRKNVPDSELEKVDGGMDPITDLQQNPPLAQKNPGGDPPAGTPGGPGGGIYDDLQQNPPDGGPDADA